MLILSWDNVEYKYLWRMGHLCQFCQKSFSQSYNKDRYERQSCWNHSQKEQEDSQLTMNAAFPEVETDEEDEKRGEEGKENGDDEDEDESMDSDDEDDDEIVENDSESDSNDPWENLRAEVGDAQSPSYVKQVERFLDKGASKAAAKARAMNVVLPAHRRRSRRLYIYYLKWFRHLRRDSVHQEVMNTLRRFMDDESMDYEEAAEAAVDKRKFLLNRLFERRQVPDEEEEEQDTNQKDEET